MKTVRSAFLLSALSLLLFMTGCAPGGGYGASRIWSPQHTRVPSQTVLENVIGPSQGQTERLQSQTRNDLNKHPPV